MRKFIGGVLLGCIVSAGIAIAQVHVRGYTRSNGTYVAPHVRSSPNGTTADNWGANGNVTPYEGIAPATAASTSIAENNAILAAAAGPSAPPSSPCATTPVRYSVCDPDTGKCWIEANFLTKTGCESYLAMQGAWCHDEPGKIICDRTQKRLGRRSCSE